MQYLESAAMSEGGDEKVDVGKTALEQIREGKLDDAKALLETELAAIAREDADGRTLLHWAAGISEEAVALILDLSSKVSRFDIDAGDGAGWTPLHVAAGAGVVGAVTLLLRAGATVDAKAGSNGSTPLAIAVSRGHELIVQKLLDAKARPGAKDSRGVTPLQRAAAGNRVDLIAKLLKAGAPLNATDERGWTALHCAMGEAADGAIIALLRAGADPMRETKDKQTALDVVPDDKYAGHIAQLIAEERLNQS